MLYKYSLKEKIFNPLDEVNFSTLKIFERQDIEKWIEEQPDLVGEELLIITTEYDKFNKTNKRLDILALDKNGKIVVLELKRDDSGRNVELQALKYAAFCSTFTLDGIIKERKIYLEKKGKTVTEQNVLKEIEEFIENPEFQEVDDKPRIILISKEFRLEVTATVLWLRTFQVDISCVKLTPYKINESEIGIIAQKIIPLQEAEDYQIQVEKKDGGNKGLSRTQKEYLDFWTELKNKIESKLPIRLSNPPTTSYYSVPSGVGGIHFEWIFQGRPRNKFGVEIHFERSVKEHNKHNLNLLKPYLSKLESKIKMTAIIEENWTKRWCRLYFKLDQGNIDDNLKRFAENVMIEMYSYFKPIIEREKEKFK